MREGLTLGQYVFVKMLRKWAAARASSENPLPHLHGLLGPFDPPPDLALAASSLFDLVEASLGRELAPGHCCSEALSRDEVAMIGLVRHAGCAGQPYTDAVVPHGLPGALRWAVFATDRALRSTFGATGMVTGGPSLATVGAGCPFAADADAPKILAEVAASVPRQQVG